MTLRRVAFTTLGCKVNMYDSEAMLALFRRAGYEAVPFREQADVYVINTCTVTGRAAAKSRQLIRQAIRQAPDAVVAVTGCYAQTNPDDVAAIPGVDLIIGNQDRHRIVDLCEEAAGRRDPLSHVQRIWNARRFEAELEVPEFTTRTRAVIKIQEGCNIFCTFCIIPYARGAPRSRDAESVFREAVSLAREGFREVVLTGIHLGSYGKDFRNFGKPYLTLAQVVEALTEIEGIDRIRLSSLEPGHVSQHLIDLMAQHPKVCRHLHLSLQSGSEAVLRRMKRAYTAAEFREAVRRIKERVPDVGLNTDIIVGFPGETEAEHQESLAFVREMGFSRLHVFPFSPRQGTPAATMPDQVDGKVKERRAREMQALGDELALAFHRRYLGQTVEVLAEEAGPDGWLEGYTGNYIRVRFPAGDELHNCLIPVRITHVGSESCSGEMDGHPIGPRQPEQTAAPALPGPDQGGWLPLWEVARGGA